MRKMGAENFFLMCVFILERVPAREGRREGDTGPQGDPVLTAASPMQSS